jgi:hypothetical protein
VNKKDNNGGAHKPDQKDQSGEGMGNLKNEKEEKNRPYDRGPCLENCDKLGVKLPSSPRPVELK